MLRWTTAIAHQLRAGLPVQQREPLHVAEPRLHMLQQLRHKGNLFVPIQNFSLPETRGAQMEWIRLNKTSLPVKLKLWTFNVPSHTFLGAPHLYSP